MATPSPQSKSDTITQLTPSATVIYDTERPSLSSSSSSSPSILDPPDMSEIMNRKHPFKRFLTHLELPRNLQLPLTCLSIGLSAVQANGVYCWPT